MNYQCCLRLGINSGDSHEEHKHGLKKRISSFKYSLCKHSLSNTHSSMYRSHLHINIACHRILWSACGCFILLSGQAFRKDFRQCMCEPLIGLNTSNPLMCVLPSPFEAKHVLSLSFMNHVYINLIAYMIDLP